MALKGNLKDFSATQLLNLINLARKTGELNLQTQKARTQMFFREGKLIYAARGQTDGHLVSMLRQIGKLSSDQAQAIQSRPEAKNDKELARLLMRAGYVSRNDIVQGVKTHVLDIVYRLFTWLDGSFLFNADVLPPDDKITVTIDLDNVIMEGSRRIKEWERLQDELPDLDMALRFTDNPSARLRNISLSVEEWRVISFINPRNTIRQIAQSNNMTDFQIRKVVYGMLQAGLVELVRPEGREPPGVDPSRGIRKPAVKRSVVEKLIDRIKRL
ncbi:MAG: DUF4388 domain-containing protein [Promethearchaeota archaeon]